MTEWNEFNVPDLISFDHGTDNERTKMIMVNGDDNNI